MNAENIETADLAELIEGLQSGQGQVIATFVDGAICPQARLLRTWIALGAAAHLGYRINGGDASTTPTQEAASGPTQDLDGRLAVIDARLNDLSARATTVNVAGPEVNVTTQNQPFETEIVRDKDGEISRTIQRPVGDAEGEPVSVRDFKKKLLGAA